ncbi:hypothetical protein D3C80_691730 [compost metagenome]
MPLVLNDPHLGFGRQITECEVNSHRPAHAFRNCSSVAGCQYDPVYPRISQILYDDGCIWPHLICECQDAGKSAVQANAHGHSIWKTVGCADLGHTVTLRGGTAFTDKRDATNDNFPAGDHTLQPRAGCLVDIRWRNERQALFGRFADQRCRGHMGRSLI